MHRFFYTLMFFFIIFNSVGQKSFFADAVEFEQHYGNILTHSPEMATVIKGHPSGQMISFINKTNGEKPWHKIFNYPDYGYYFVHQQYANPVIGENYGAGVFYNFYFLKKYLSVKLAQGLAYNTNPHDPETNNKNTAFGSHFLFNTNLTVGLKKYNLYRNFGLQTGVTFTHFSNGKIASPNSGINTVNVALGFNYNFEKRKAKQDSLTSISMKYTEPIKYNFVARFGVNESQVIGSGQKPFYHLSIYADKRINRKSAIQLGADAFFTTSLKEFIRYRAISFPEKQVDINTDYRRIGIFVGHELFVSKISIETQVGYYVYRPFGPVVLRLYNRVGAKYYLNKNLFTGLAIKTHGFLAEAAEFSIGYRL
ncbi:MAG: hypothetical protein RLZZ312_1130 [Bacteroidota bacterium]